MYLFYINRFFVKKMQNPTTTEYVTIVHAVANDDIEATKQMLSEGERLLSACFHVYCSVEMLKLFEQQKIQMKEIQLLPRAFTLLKQNEPECLEYICEQVHEQFPFDSFWHYLVEESIVQDCENLCLKVLDTLVSNKS